MSLTAAPSSSRRRQQNDQPIVEKVTDYLTAVDTQMPPKLTGLGRTAQYFSFTTIGDLQDYWKTDVWEPYATYLLDNVITPERDAAAASGKPRTRSYSFQTVAALLEDGEGCGKGRYSRTFPDKANFTPVDHFCYAMFHMRAQNTTLQEGLFYNRSKLRPHWKLCLIWSMLQVWFYEHTPSRVRKREQAALKRAGKAALESVKRPRKLNDQSSFSATHTLGSAHTESEVDPDGDTSDQDDFTGFQPSLLDDTDAPVDPEVLAMVQERLRASNISSEVANIVTGQDVELLTPMQKMRIESINNDDRSRGFKYNLLLAVQKGWLEPGLIEDHLYQLADADRTIDDHAWQRQLEKITNDTEFPQGDPVLPFDLAADNEKESFLENQSLFDDVACQPQGHAAACKRMGILRPDYPRYKSMPVTYAFKFWQVLAFDWIHDQKQSGLNGVLLCDSMGLGKTWEIIGYMLSTLHKRRSALANGDTVPPARPFLVVVPPGILPNQWASQIKSATMELNIVKYWGELGDILNSSRSKPLAKDDALFNGAETNASQVIITTYHTWRSRHGPLAQESFRVKKQNWSAERARRDFNIADKAWPHLLKGCFSDVILDEATFIKSMTSQAHTAIKWLKTFTILVTATPDINSVNDFEAYIDFIEPSGATLQEKIHSQVTTPVTFNPYVDIPETEIQGKLLRCTLNNFKKFILDRPDKIQQGRYLGVLYADCMIRRSHVSRVDGKMIGNDIPALKHRRAECDWHLNEEEAIDEYKIYKAYSKDHVRQLIRVDENNNVHWNWRHYRALLLLSTWTGFTHIEHKMQAEAVPRLLAKGNQLLAWIVRNHHDATGEAFPDDLPGLLAVVCRGAPKIRALLHLIAHIVVLLEEKVLIFCSVPAQQLLVYAILSALEIPTRVYHAKLDRSEKLELQYDFNKTDETRVLIGTFATTAVGIDLQNRCHWVWFLDPPPSIAIGEQASGRCHRVGQTQTVEVVTLVAKRSFNDRQVRNNLKKAIPGVIAALNKEAFRGAELAYNDDGDARLKLGEWVCYNGRLIRTDDPRLPANHGEPTLSSIRVIREIIEMKMGLRFGWADENSDE